MVLRCLIDLEYDVYEIPQEFRNIDVDAIPGIPDLERSALKVAAFHYTSHGKCVLTLEKYNEAGSELTQHAKDALEMYNFLQESWLKYRVPYKSTDVFPDIQVGLRRRFSSLPNSSDSNRS